MIISFETLGCKLNQSESESLAAAFSKRGFSVRPFSLLFKGKELPDLILFNTCTVTSMAQQKARRLIKKAAALIPFGVVVVTGCYAQMDPDEIRALGENILIADMAGKSRLMDLPSFLQGGFFSGLSLYQQVEQFLAQPLSFQEEQRVTDRFRFQSEEGGFFHSVSGNLAVAEFHSRAFVKIQDGCNNRCSYCRIPLARGDSISLNEAEVLRRIFRVLEWGFKEVVLTGINISDWKSPSIGSNQTGIQHFPQLLLAIADLACSFGARVRLSSIEPHYLNESLLEALKHPAVTPHLHLALQSMSESVLKRMNRPSQVMKMVEWIESYRSVIKDPFLAADLITGFDGESDVEFDQTLAWMKKLNFAHLHVFPFSPREGTLSFSPKVPIPQRIRDERAASLRQLSDEGYQSYLATQEGKKVSLLVEGFLPVKKEKGSLDAERSFFLLGVSENYLRPEVVIVSSSLPQYQKKEIIPVLLHQENQKLIGKILEKH